MSVPLPPLRSTSKRVTELPLFTAEDEFGLMVGQREIIMQPTRHLGPLEIINSDFAEGLFVGLLPYQESSPAKRASPLPSSAPADKAATR